MSTRLEPRLILGKNYVETLILTFEQFLLQNPGDLGLQEYIVKKLERVLCSIAYTVPHIRNVYHSKVREILGEMFPDLPKPDFKTCFVLGTLVEWMRSNRGDIIKMSELGVISMDEVNEKIRESAIDIIQTAIFSTLIEASIINM